ncbi:MAG: glutathione S-transferase domain-containing protein [Chloroflexota bacterium]
MMPDTPLARAYERMWCDFVGGIYGPAYRINMAKDEATARENIAAAKAKFAQLEEEVTGPLFNGENFGLVDATAAPLFRRLGYVQQLRPDLDVFSGTPKVKAWRDALMSRPSVENSVLPNLFDLFKERAAKTESWILSERTAE